MRQVKPRQVKRDVGQIGMTSRPKNSTAKFAYCDATLKIQTFNICEFLRDIFLTFFLDVNRDITARKWRFATSRVNSVLLVAQCNPVVAGGGHDSSVSISTIVCVCVCVLIIMLYLVHLK